MEDRRAYISQLYDCYSGVLSERKREALDLYYNDDLSLSEVAECVFPRVALSRADIEAIVAGFNAQGLDGILILLLTYSQGQYLVHAMQRNSLPLALTLVQPDETVGDDFEELELTVNQGIHGSQDNANCLLRAGIPCAFFAGSRKNGELAAFVRDFGAAARTVEAMRRMRIGVIGRLPGMGDVVTDDMAVYRVLGPEFVYDSIGTVRRLCAEADEKEIARLMALEEGNGRGDRVIAFRNGSGLAFTVSPDRGMDLVDCSFGGIPLVFRSQTGYSAGARHEASGKGWLRNWQGGNGSCWQGGFLPEMRRRLSGK